MDRKPPTDHRILLKEKLDYFRKERVLASDPEIKFQLDQGIRGIEEELAGYELGHKMEESSGPDQRVNYRPVNRSVLKKDLSLLQRLGFRFWSRRRRAERAWRCSGAFDENEIIRLWQDVDGAHDIPLCLHNGSTVSNALSWLTKELKKADNSRRFYLLLGETGTGKSTLLANLFLRLADKWGKKTVLLVRLNESFPLETFSIKGDTQTTLLLDGIDEHPAALAEPAAFLAKLEYSLRNFHRVVISGRTQFFTDRLSERQRTATRPANDYTRLEVQQLDETMVKIQIGKKFSPLQDRERYQLALKIVAAGRELFSRPLLLPFLDRLIERRRDLVFYGLGLSTARITAYEVYEFAVREWIDREAEKLPADRDRQAFSARLTAAMRELAHNFYLRETNRRAAAILYTDLSILEESYREALHKEELRVKSLLHRDAAGNFRFAHRTFKEYFYAQLVFEGIIAEENFSFFHYPDAARFLAEKALVEYGRGYGTRAIKPNLLDRDWASERNLSAISVLLRAAGLEEHTSHFEGLTEFMRDALDRSAWRDAYTAIAWRLLPGTTSTLPLPVLGEIASTYGLDTTDLFAFPFFRQSENGGGFIHRAFGEMLLMRQLLSVGTELELREAYAEFPFAQLRFAHLIPDELAWLQLAVSGVFPLIRSDYLPTLAEEKASKGGVGYDEMEERSRIGPLQFERYRNNLSRSPRLSIRFPDTADNERRMHLLASWPAADRIEALDIGYNQLCGALDLRRFTRLLELVVSGNRRLDWDRIQLPPSLIELKTADPSSRLPARLTSLHQKILPAYAEKPQDHRPEMVSIIGGSFWMGDDESESQDEKPLHLVHVSNFSLSKYPITVRQYAAFVSATGYRTLAEREGWSLVGYRLAQETGGWFYTYKLATGRQWRYDPFGKLYADGDLDCPVVCIAWEDAVAYCKWLSEETGENYRLPTEAEWEYAAIGGGNSGHRDEQGHCLRAYTYAGGDDLDAVAWHFRATNKPGTRPVGGKVANQLGLYDMSGNVWEWCADWYGSGYYAASEDAVENPRGPDSGVPRVLRGGSWVDNPVFCRAANRGANPPRRLIAYVGFRVARAPRF